MAVSRDHDLSVALDRYAVWFVIGASYICRDLAIAVKCGVEAAVGVVTRQCEVPVSAIVIIAGSCDYDLCVALDRYAVCKIIRTSYIGRDLAIAVKCGIQAAVGAVTRQCEFIAAPNIAESCDHDLSVALDRYAECIIIGASYSCRDLAIAVKCGIQAAVGVVTRQCEVIVAPIIAVSCDHDHSVALDRYAACKIIGASYICRDLAIAVKGGIQAAVGVVTRQCEVPVAAIKAGSCDHDLSVALDRYAESSIIDASYICRDLAIAVKGGIEAAVGVVTRQYKFIGSPIIAGSRDQDLPVALDRYAVCFIIGASYSCRDLAIAVKCGIQAAVGVVARQCEVIVASIKADSCDHDLSVALDRYAACFISEASYSCRDLTITIKSGIEVASHQCALAENLRFQPSTIRSALNGPAFWTSDEELERGEQSTEPTEWFEPSKMQKEKTSPTPTALRIFRREFTMECLEAIRLAVALAPPIS